MKKKPSASRLELPDDLQSLVEKREQADRRSASNKAAKAGGDTRAERRKKTRRSDDADGKQR